MILVDANLLLYAVLEGYPQHRAAKTWLDTQLNSPIRVAMPWESLLAFFRVATNPRLFESPLGASQAWGVIEGWLALPRVWTPVAEAGHAQRLTKLIEGGEVRAGLVHDAHLAALAMSFGLILCSSDGDFARFEGLRWQNPLTPRSTER